MSELWAVAGDENTHGAGNLIPDNPQTVFIEGTSVIEHDDPAEPDALCPLLGPPHCSPSTLNGSSTVFVYGKPAHRHNDERICTATTIVTGQSTVFVGG
jgi:uncharacterized Zn-binding protein involved in type VI secretion